MRGNVDTRLRKLARAEVDAILLAAAGIRRLGLAPAGMVPLNPRDFVPAIGQGILALEARVGDADVLAVLRPFDDPATRAAAEAERAFLSVVGGDCRTPLAARSNNGRSRCLARVRSCPASRRGAITSRSAKPESRR